MLQTAGGSFTQQNRMLRRDQSSETITKYRAKKYADAISLSWLCCINPVGILGNHIQPRQLQRLSKTFVSVVYRFSWNRHRCLVTGVKASNDEGTVVK